MDFSKINVLVLGDIFLDEYQFGDCHRISQEAPVPILNIDRTKTKRTLGGAGNTAANVISLGGNCVLVGRVGFDDEAVIGLCDELGIAFHPVLSVHCPTAVKTRFVGQRQQILRVDSEKIAPLSNREHSEAKGLFARFLNQADVVVISDYAKGFFNKTLCEQIIKGCKDGGPPVIVDPKPCNASFYEGADYITPNQLEHDSVKGIRANVLLTRGADGMEYFGTNGTHLVRPTLAKEVFDVAGAGDTVVAAFALAIASKMPIEEAIDFANKAAGIVVGKQGTSTVTKEEIEKLN